MSWISISTKFRVIHRRDFALVLWRWWYSVSTTINRDQTNDLSRLPWKCATAETGKSSFMNIDAHHSSGPEADRQADPATRSRISVWKLARRFFHCEMLRISRSYRSCLRISGTKGRHSERIFTYRSAAKLPLTVTKGLKIGIILFITSELKFFYQILLSFFSF